MRDALPHFEPVTEMAMLYPQNGSIAIGSRRTMPTFPVAAAVVSLAMVALNTPCRRRIQINAVMRRAAAAEYECGDGHAFSLPTSAKCWATAAQARCNARSDAPPAPSTCPTAVFPIDQLLGGGPPGSLPPGLAVGRDRDVGEDGVLAATLPLRCDWSSCPCRARRRKSRFGIDGVQITVVGNLHPRDTVVDGPDAIALALERADHHGEICFSAGARKRRAHR